MADPRYPGRQRTARSSFGLTSGRVEAFSDGVFAIAVTLLILNVQLPAFAPGSLLTALLRLWPEYATYAASFMTIGIMWLNHHSLFSRIARVDRSLILLNLGLLMVIAFVPFSTEVLGHHIGSPDANVAALFYALTALLIAVGFSSVYVYVASHPSMLSPGFTREDLFRAMPWFTIGLASYLVCLPLSFISPPAVVVLVAATAIYYAFDRLPGPRDETGPGVDAGE